ncbi:MAG: translation initiation factor IF-3 [Clostridia bacterium]|nr:translation initiation factor IF-3 [Clostridia bacterium]
MFIPSFCCKLTGRCAKISTTKDNTLINDDINLPSVRLIDEDGKPLGIVTSEQAKEFAYDKNLDLVLIAPQADPPVCRIMDYGKFRFDKIKKEKESRKKQQSAETKQIQLSIVIGDNDFNTKLNHANKFLKNGDKVRVVVRFRSRQIQHKDLGYDILNRFTSGCAEYGSCDKPPVEEGRNLSLLIVPLKPDQKKGKAEPKQANNNHKEESENGKDQNA